jgi:TatD DNase family protein
MLFDSHAHLNFKAFDEDRDAVIARCRDANMLVMNVGAAYATSKSAAELATNQEFCYASIGLHPIHIYDEEFNVSAYQALIDGNPKIRAIGECGFDLWHVKRDDLPLEDIKEKQKTVFEQHINLALKNDLALIIHGRNGAEDLTAYKSIYEVVERKKVKRAVVHCYGGDLEEAMMFAGQGFYIGFTGIVTFDKTGKLDEIIQALTLEQILIETDAPYLTPVPYRGTRNEPPYVIEVAKHIAKVKNVSVEGVVATTGENAKRLYGIR